MKKLVLLLAACLPLTACAGTPSDRLAQNNSNKSIQELEEDFTARLSRFAGPDQANKLVYKLLLAEIALQRGRPTVAASTYMELAKTTRDLRIIQRATEVGLLARMPQVALEATTMWLEVEPDSAQARQIMASLLAATGKIDEAKVNLEKMLRNDGPQRAQTFLQLNSLLSRYSDKLEVLKLVQELAQPYQSLAEARYATAIAAYTAKNNDLALAEARQAQQLRPGWESAANIEAQVLLASDPQQALEFYRGFLEKHPHSKILRLGYARTLIEQKQGDSAKSQLDLLLREAPQDADNVTTVGLLWAQLKEYDKAEMHLKRALELSPRDTDNVRMFLGQVYEDNKRYEDAEKMYRQVGREDDQFIPAQIKVGNMLARQGKMVEARNHLNNTEAQGGQRVQLILAEAQILRESREYQTAYDRLTKGLDEFPGTPDLLYDRALVAEKLDRLDMLEQDLRLLIKLKPDHAHAYNALGYTLADRTDRLQEALELIEKALKLAPEDAFIIDSLGWLQYRMGKLEESAETLRTAYTKRPDAEIAAHLGEVLWAQGKKEEAQKIWRNALSNDPENEALVGVMRKFAAQ